MTAQGQGQQRGGGGRDAGGRVVNPMEWRHVRFLERESRVKRVVEGNKACVILASDASMEWGFARQALVALAKDPNNLVILTEEQSTGSSGLGKQVWDLYNSSQSSGGNGGAKVVSPDGVGLDYREASTTTTLSPDERAVYETYATKQRLRHSELQGDNTNPDPTAAGDEIVDPQDEAEESSDSEDDEEGDEDAEHQGRALNLSAQLNIQAQKKNKLASAGVADAELGVNVLLRGRIVDGKVMMVGRVHDYDVRGRKGREKVFPFVVGRLRGDEFGEVVRGEEYLRAEEKVEGLEVGGGGAVGGKRKWGDDGGVGRRRGESRGEGRGGNKRVKRGEGGGGGVGGTGDDIDAAIARATGEGGGVGGGAGGGEEGSSDEDEESDYDPDDAVSAPDAPRKVVYTDRTLEVRCRISYVDFSALHDLRALLMIVPLMRPRKVILTAGSEGEMGSLVRAFGEVEIGGERGMEVVVGRVGVQVDASVDTNAWTLKLGRGLVRRLRWQEVKGLGVVAVTGWLGVGEEEGGEVDEGVKKKMKLVKGEEEEEDGGGETKVVVKVGKGEKMPVLDLLATATMGASITSAVQPTRPVHVGDTRLADLRAQLRLAGHEAQFSGEGTLLIDGCVVVRKSGDLAGRLEIESVGMQAVGGFEELSCICISLEDLTANMFWQVLQYALIIAGTAIALYVGLLALLTIPIFQTHVVYLHAIRMTWWKDLDVPEIFGFLHNQVTPFNIKSPNSETLYTWHILPVGLYLKHEKDLLTEPTGFVSGFTDRLAFKLLRDDPEALLVIHFHGAGGTVGSGYRCPNYRALSAGQPNKIHVLTFDYRGFGRSTGSPSERGIILDALAVVEWAVNVAQIPPERIVMYSQSLGTAVNVALAEHYALQDPPVVFAGHILTAPMVDVPTLVSTYSVAGTIPILGPIARFSIVFQYLQSFIKDKWSTKDRIASYVRACEASDSPYRLTLLHAEDDYDIPWTHTPVVFWHAVNATQERGMTFKELDDEKAKIRTDLGAAGSVVEWKTSNGIIREEILKYGLHDVIMGNPIVTLAVLRMLECGI
ncbi:hypothetical protein LTR27_004282 [Elasticomyces elasticus]|nr:hypothetical protein LTR27_004282 [Elasticomyces elasticus]